MTTTPRTWVVGEVTTAAMMNAEIRDQFSSIFDAWTTYTPTWAATGVSPSLGNGSLTGRYMKVGRTCTAAFLFTSGGTTTYGTGGYTWSLPFQTANATVFYFGVARLVASATWLGQILITPNGTTCLATFPSATGTTTGVTLSGTAPVTLAAGDQLRAQVTYQTAS